MDWFLYDNGLRHERVKIFHIIRLLKSAILKYFTTFKFIKHPIRNSIIKPFDLLNTIPLTRIKKVFYSLLMRKF